MVIAIARFAVRHRKAVLAAAALFVVLSIALGAGVVSRMSGAGFSDPASASIRAEQAVSSQFHSGTPNFVLLVKASGGVDAPDVAAAGTLLVLRVMTTFTDVSVYSLNLTTGLGLGLAIDYALFVVTRYREELARGASYDDAVVASARTAGRTVAFSAMTVALSLAALLVFPLFFLRSFGYAGIAVVVIAALGALLVLPALLSVLGPRIDKGQIFARKPADSTHGFWHTTALEVISRPLVAGRAVIAVLVVLGL